MIETKADLTQKDYQRIRDLVYAQSGINLGDNKMQLVRARLGKRIRSGNYKSFGDYFEEIEQDTTGQRLGELLDAISTNTTHLFRETRHFNLLAQIARKWADDQQGRRTTFRVWSAGCSSGEEPYSLAMTLLDALRGYPNIELKILATDLSSRMLTKAKLGLFDTHRVGTVPPPFKKQFLRKTQKDGQVFLEPVSQVRQAITFARFNLMTPSFPFRHGFQVIFCRNVMIYFDRPTQEGLVSRFVDQLQSGGYLMIGHSESLNGISHSLSYVEPTVYRKT